MTASRFLTRLKSVHGLGLALGLILVANAIVLAGVYANRQGQPTSSISLTHREFYLRSYGRGEDSGVTVQLRWQTSRDPDDRLLDAAKLAELGFDLPPDSDVWARDKYKVISPRVAYVVLEYDGPAWQQLLQHRRAALDKALEKARDDRARKRLQDNFDRFRQEASRLVLVDVGINPGALRKRYPDRARDLIARARIAAYRRTVRDPETKKRSWTLSGRVSSLLPSTITVPSTMGDLLITTRTTRYGSRRSMRDGVAVTLDYGRRYEPWVASVRPGSVPSKP